MIPTPITPDEVADCAAYLRTHRISIALGNDPEAERQLNAEPYPPYELDRRRWINDR